MIYTHELWGGAARYEARSMRCPPCGGGADLGERRVVAESVVQLRAPPAKPRGELRTASAGLIATGHLGACRRILRALNSMEDHHGNHRQCQSS